MLLTDPTFAKTVITRDHSWFSLISHLMTIHDIGRQNLKSEGNSVHFSQLTIGCILMSPALKTWFLYVKFLFEANFCRKTLLLLLPPIKKSLIHIWESIRTGTYFFHQKVSVLRSGDICRKVSIKMFITHKSLHLSSNKFIFISTKYQMKGQWRGLS
jgi:hypothetical protein